MQDLLLLLATVLFLSVGFLAPFVMSLAYVWVDIFTPQAVSASLLADQPIAMLFGVCAIAIYVLRDRRDPPRLGMTAVFQLLICFWITCTLQWAVAPDAAWWRYSIDIKVCLFAVFLPYVIRSRVQIEALMLVYLLSIAGHLVPWGVKTFITGGGYGQSLGLLRSNSAFLAESSTVSAVGVMIVPVLLVMRKHSLLLPRNRLTDISIWIVVVLSLVGAIGTFARTALVAFAVSAAAMWLRSKRKILFSVGLVVMAGILFSVTSDRWTARISTVADYENENSAAVRLQVWQWAWDFAQSHPFGGGFSAFVTSRIETPSLTGGPALVQVGRAYHNILFGVLADQGYIGIFLYVGMLVSALWGLQKARNLTLKLPEHVWCADLAQAVQIALITMLAAGMFVEIGWTPLVWYLISMSICLREYARRVTKPAKVMAWQPGGLASAARGGGPLADRGPADRGLADRGLADRGLADHGVALHRSLR